VSTADTQLLIIGGGLSGIAAGIRAARFGIDTLILEQHTIPGGLNSYYSRQGFLLETGLHAMTNFAERGNKKAPLNRLFRQLKLSRKKFVTHQQFTSKILFPQQFLEFSNDITLLQDTIAKVFPQSIDGFMSLVFAIDGIDPFADVPWQSTKEFLHSYLHDVLLEDMLLLPLMVYGNSEEHDMDLGQFVIMFRALFQEGFFRPDGTMKEFLWLLVDHYKAFGGQIRFKAKVSEVMRENSHVSGVILEDGSQITCDTVLSTIGTPGTSDLIGWPEKKADHVGQMSFVETISILPIQEREKMQTDHTIIFYNNHEHLVYCRPQMAIDPDWGVICFPENFHDLPEQNHFQVRVTNSASYKIWSDTPQAEYVELKRICQAQTEKTVSKIIGNYTQNRVYHDSFTPLTIERYTAKAEGAVYGSPIKNRNGETPYDNFFIAGTDQGFLGIVGAMLSGVTIVNQRVLI
jgi:phytoene dehydrogenase-like protein